MSPAMLSGGGSPAPAQPSGSRNRGGCWPQGREAGGGRVPRLTGAASTEGSEGAVYPTRPRLPSAYLCPPPPPGLCISRDQRPLKVAFSSLSPTAQLVHYFKIIPGGEGLKFALHRTCNKMRSSEAGVTIYLCEISLIALNSLLCKM